MAKTNPKSFFNYVSSKTKAKSGVPNLINDTGKLTDTDLEKAEVLKSFFSSVFTEETDDPLPDFNTKSDTTTDFINITVESMTKKLNSLKVCKSPGPDGLHPKVLKELSSVIALPLTLLFNKTMSDCKIPSS